LLGGTSILLRFPIIFILTFLFNFLFLFLFLFFKNKKQGVPCFLFFIFICV